MNYGYKWHENHAVVYIFAVCNRSKRYPAVSVIDKYTIVYKRVATKRHYLTDFRYQKNFCQKHGKWILALDWLQTWHDNRQPFRIWHRCMKLSCCHAGVIGTESNSQAFWLCLSLQPNLICYVHAQDWFSYNYFLSNHQSDNSVAYQGAVRLSSI